MDKPKEKVRAEVLASLQEQGEKLRGIRERMQAELPPDDPLHGMAFQLGKLLGETEAALRSGEPSE